MSGAVPPNHLPIGPADLAAGESKVVTFLGRPVRIDRAADGAWTATDLVCRHQNHSLVHAEVRDEGKRRIAICPAHGWQYDLASGECLNEPWARLRRRAVESVDGKLYLSMSPLAEGTDLPSDRR